jgi:hypothetical protein
MQDPDGADTHAIVRTSVRGPLGGIPNYLIEAGVLICLLLATLAINWRMIHDGVNGGGDVRWHLTWLQHFSKQLTEGMLYPRWLAGTNFGYGSPTFVFYPPLVYYLGAGVKALGLTFDQTVSVLFSGGILLSGLSFYLFARPRWGWLPAGFGALAYMLSPGLLGLVKGGGLAPLYTFIWPPLLLLFTEQAIRKTSYLCALVLLWLLVALTHLPSLLIYAIAWMLYSLPLLWQQPWDIRLQIWLTALLGWGLAAFFLIPAVLEQRYINIDYMLASQSGFQANMYNLVETVQIGWRDIFFRQWLACAAFAGIAAVGFVRLPQQRRLTSLLWLIAMGIVVLMNDLSWPVWKVNPILQKIEYAGRIDRILYLVEASLCALAVQSIERPAMRLNRASQVFSKTLLFVIVCAILLSNFKFHHDSVRRLPGLYSSGNGVMQNRAWIERIRDNPYRDGLIDVPEYRPRLDDGANGAEALSFVKETLTEGGLPVSPQRVLGRLPTPQPNQRRFEITQGKAEVSITHWRSDRRELSISASEPTTVVLRLYAYPSWHLYLNGAPHPMAKAADGRLQFEVPPGRFDLVVRYEKTRAFKLGLAVSGLSAIAFSALSYHWLWAAHKR